MYSSSICHTFRSFSGKKYVTSFHFLLVSVTQIILFFLLSLASFIIPFAVHSNYISNWHLWYAKVITSGIQSKLQLWQHDNMYTVMYHVNAVIRYLYPNVWCKYGLMEFVWSLHDFIICPLCLLKLCMLPLKGQTDIDLHSLLWLWSTKTFTWCFLVR